MDARHWIRSGERAPPGIRSYASKTVASAQWQGRTALALSPGRSSQLKHPLSLAGEADGLIASRLLSAEAVAQRGSVWRV